MVATSTVLLDMLGSLTRRGLEHYGVPRWSAVPINANRASVFFQPRMVENVGLRGDVCALHQYAPRGRRVLCVIRIYSRLWGLLLPAAAVNNNNVLARMLASSLWQLRRRGSDISGS